MATTPEIKTLNASAMDILNVIRANASSTYQERIPEATQDNIREIGNAMLTYESTQNEFLNALVNRIARVIVTSKSYQNPLRMFKKGVLEFGETIEEIFVNIARAHQFDPAVAEKEVFKREIPDVNAVFHKMNYQNFYKTTISNEQLRQAFLSYQGISDLIARIVDSLYTGSEFDEFLVMKQLIVDAANDGKMYAVTIPEVTPDNAKTIVAKIKGVSNSMEFMSTTYNSMGVLNYTKKENQIFLIDAAFDAMIDVEVLASAFNMSKAEFMGQRVLIDKDWFMVFDNWIGFTENYNGQGLYWNYFYHCWKTFSTSPFSNAVLFTTNATSVTSVTVTPPTAELTKGSSMQFSAAVVTSGYVPKGVTWSVSGASDTVSTITPDGLLTVPTAEQNTTLTVTATSVYDASKKGTSTVTLN